MDDCQLGTLIIIINTIIVIIIVIIIAITIIVIITRPMIIVNDNGLKQRGEGTGMVGNGSPLYNYILTRKSHCAKRSRPTRTRIQARTCARVRQCVTRQ